MAQRSEEEILEAAEEVLERAKDEGQSGFGAGLEDGVMIMLQELGLYEEHYEDEPWSNVSIIRAIERRNVKSNNNIRPSEE